MKLLRWIGAAILVASLPLATILPVSFSFENGPIENTQVLIVFSGAIMALMFAMRDQTAQRWFWLAAVPVWLAMCGRELSWGAAFLPPVSITDHGPQFSSSLLWYRPYVTPGLFGALAVSIAAFLWGGGHRVFARLAMARQFPGGDIALFALSMLVSAAAEGKMGLSLPAIGDAQVAEETAELAAYVFILSAQARVAIALQALRGDAETAGEKRKSPASRRA